MQISKTLTALCALSIGFSFVSLKADDTDAQNKAREALRQKMNDLGGPATNAPAPVVAPKPPKESTKVAKPAPAPVQPVAEPPAEPIPAPTDSDAIAKAREAMRQKLAETTPQPAVRSVPPPVQHKPKEEVKKSAPKPKPAPMPAPQQASKPVQEKPAKAAVAAPMPAPVTQPATTPAHVEQAATPVAPVPMREVSPGPAPVAAQPYSRQQLVLPPSVDAETSAKTRDALRQKMNQLETQPAGVAATPTTTRAMPARPVTVQAPPATTTPATAATAVTTPGSAPVTTAQPVAGTVNAAPNPPAQAHATTQAMGTPKPTKKSAHGKATTQSFQTLEGPPSHFSPNTQAKLNEILRQYRADEITPEQYHMMRAKLLAEP